MESTYQQLATLVFEAAAACKIDRFLVAIAGAPGSGKTTIANEIVRLLNSNGIGVILDGSTAAATSASAGAVPQAIAISMDGFHLSRSVLDALANRKETYICRGAPWTFDVKRVVALAQMLRGSAEFAASSRGPLYAPTFDHAIKDPVENGALIPGPTSIVTLEGNYLLLDEEDWREVSRLVDLRIFVKVDPVEARIRVANRHVQSGIETNLEDGEGRFDQNDGINGNLIRARMIRPDITVESRPERGTGRGT